MEEKKSGKRYHRGRRKKKKKSGILTNIILIIAIIVFCYSGFQLFTIYKGYSEGEQEYESIVEQVVSIENKGKEKERFVVDFDALYEMNADVVGWIRFEEPAVINYPIVQGRDNDKYLNQTFQGYDNTVGSIFVNAYNSPKFDEQSTIVYGHRMNNGTMFNKLGEYEEKEFWEKHPFFYIYKPDNTELKYHIYSVGIVKETSPIYKNYQGNIEDFKSYIELTKDCSFYDTGIEVTEKDKIVVLSTCTNEDDTERLIVVGVKIGENPL